MSICAHKIAPCLLNVIHTRFGDRIYHHGIRQLSVVGWFRIQIQEIFQESDAFPGLSVIGLFDFHCGEFFAVFFMIG